MGHFEESDKRLITDLANSGMTRNEIARKWNTTAKRLSEFMGWEPRKHKARTERSAFTAEQEEYLHNLFNAGFVIPGLAEQIMAIHFGRPFCRMTIWRRFRIWKKCE